MPNKRKKGKSFIAGWLEQSDADAFKVIAAEMGYTTTDLLTILVREEIKRAKKQNRNKKGGK